jgi:TonB family protein
MPRGSHVLALFVVLLSPTLARAQEAVRVAAASTAPDVETRLAFGPIAVGIKVVGADIVALRATDQDLEVQLGVRRDALGRWLSKAEVMLLLVGDIEPVAPLKSEDGTVGLRPLTTWGSPRYELTLVNRDRSRTVQAELDFEEATDLLRSLRAVAPVVEPPKLATVVDRPVMPRGGNRGPAYPEALRRSGTPGEVVLRVVVDTTGRIEDESIEVVRSSDARFLRAVRDAIASWRFIPAESEGRRVRQLVELPFVFQPGR